ncbi:unnamed protein product [Clonostachys rosea f. rosea IK726]|uniref:Uncharacterized protein n=1 Tax=Clonostachys rosea f. rosea IK726 TaxID=1349383 RepID=A0ACA9TGW0_BIOOC|nr:unnamed protein product [Clonostachys rosea f. rosea IK726]
MAVQPGDGKQIGSGGKELLERTVQILTPAFEDDPVYNWLLCDLPEPKRKAMLQKLLSGFLTQGSLNGGIFIQAENFASCGLFMPPNTSMENVWTLPSAGIFTALWEIGIGCFKRAMVEYNGSVEPLMKKAFTKTEQKEHWYVFIMATDVDRRRKGHASKLLAHLQDRAREGKHPIWLEATTDASRELYLKLGFEVVGDIVLGKGEVRDDGLLKDDGEGITIWSMLWRP